MIPSPRLLPPASSCALALSVVVASACGAGDAPSDEVLDLGGDNLGAEGAHEHGIARLSLAIDETAVTVSFRAPGASLYGFEREPRDDAERLARENARERIREDLGSFVAFDPAAGCVADEVQMNGGASFERADEGEHQGGGEHDHEHDPDHAGDGEHSEVEAQVVLHCTTSPEGSTAQLRVGEFFPEVRYVDLIVLSGTRQGGGRVDAAARFQL